MSTERIPYELLKPGGAMHYSGNIPQLSPAVAKESFDHLHKSSSIEKDHYIYDPFCGNGIVLSTVSILFPEKIAKIIGSDADPDRQNGAIPMTRINLGRTHPYGVAREIFNDRLIEGHVELPKKLARLHEYLKSCGIETQIPNSVFRHNALGPVPSNAKIQNDSVTMVLADPPYNVLCQWKRVQGQGLSHDPAKNMRTALGAMRPKLRDDAVVGVMMKAQSMDGAKETAKSFTNIDGFEPRAATIRGKAMRRTNRCLVTLEAKANA